MDNNILKHYILRVRTNQMKLEEVPEEYRYYVGLTLQRLEESKIRQEENEFHFVDIFAKPIYWFIKGSIYVGGKVAEGTKYLFESAWEAAGKVAKKEDELIDIILGRKDK